MSADVNLKHPVSSPSSPALPFWRRIRTNLLVMFVLLAVLPVAINNVLVITQLESWTHDQAFSQLDTVAALKAQLIDQWLVNGQTSLLGVTSSDTLEQRLAALALPWGSDFKQTQLAVNEILKRADDNQSVLVEIFFYDLEGTIQSSSITQNIGKSVIRQPYYQASLSDVYTQSPYYQVGSRELTMLITLPVTFRDEVVGVLAGRLNMALLGEIMQQSAGLPETAETYLVSAQSNYLLTPSQYEAYSMARAYHSKGIDRALAGESGSGTYDNYHEPPIRVLGVYRWIPGLQAALIAEQKEAAALKPYSDAQLVAMMIGFWAAVFAGIFGLYAATRFARPIMALTKAATRISAGDLQERAVVRARNELGVLAAAFNEMADQVQESVGTLEDRVAARTRDVFLTLEVGQLVSGAYNQADLLPRVADFIGEQFDLYYTQIYLLDDVRRSAVLAAGTGEVGKVLLSQGHHLSLGETAIVTRAVQTRQPVLVSDTLTSPIHRPNPLLPDTRSEVAIPLLVGGEAIGVLDMQSRQPETFREDNLPVFEAMASQLASAVRAAQAYDETRVAVDRADALNRRLTGEAWDSYLGRIGQNQRVTYEYDLRNVAVQDGAPALTGGDNGNPCQYALPVELRGQPIGSIQLEDETEREWTAEETELVREVAERVALALDQFRAFDATQKRAVEMEAVAEVGAHAAATLESDTLLWTVVELMKSRFGLYHAHIYLLDDAAQKLVLAAGAGEVGRLMTELNFQIALDHPYSMVARVARSRHGLIVNDISQTADYLPNPMLPATRSEMSVPMIVGDRVIGVLDVQSDQVGRFTNQDMQVQSTLASQIAVAVHNARSFADTVAAQRAQEESAVLLRTIIDTSPDWIFVKDKNYRFVMVNKPFAEFYGGRTPEEMIGKDDYELGSPAELIEGDPERGIVGFRTDDRAVLETGQSLHNPYDVVEFADGTRHVLDTSKLPLRDKNGQVIGVLGVSHDITERLEAEEELRKLSQAVEQNPTTVVITNLAGEIEYVNQAFVDNSGYSRAEAIGQNPRLLKSGQTPPEVYEQMWETIRAGGTWQGELLNRKKNGDLFWEQIAITSIANARGEITHYLAVKQDITERLEAEEEREELLSDLQRLSVRLQDRLKEISALQEIGAYSEENLSLDEYLCRVVKRVPSSMQYPDVCAATIEFEGDIYGDRQITDLASRLDVPLNVEGQRVGMLTAGYVESRDFLPEEESHLNAIAERVSTYIQSRRLFEQVQKHALEMQIVSQVGAEAAATLEQNELLWRVANLVKERFGLYHAHVYLLDERRETLDLVAGSGNPGKMMVVGGHRISLQHDHSVVVRAARSGQSIVVNDVLRVPEFLPNPMLPQTRSELATPLIFGGRVIGVLDVQSDRVDYFTAEDMQVQATLASQIAVAVNNAQLFTEQLALADRLREVDRLKSEFLASMSHELRTPLNSIIGYAEVLLDGIDGDLTDDMDEDVTAIHGSGKHLLNLINDILDLAKIEAGQMDLVLEAFSLAPLIEDTASTQRVLLKDKPVDLVLDLPDALPPVRADSLRVRQVLSNLITNAIKFTEQGSITVCAGYYEPDPSMLQISVIDTGIGMRPDQLQVIFDRFRQVDQSHTRRAGGTGLGLSITRQLIQMHGGDIWVESEPGVGSTFHLTLPIAAETAAD